MESYPLPTAIQPAVVSAEGIGAQATVRGGEQGRNERQQNSLGSFLKTALRTSSTTFSQTSHSFASLTSTACARQRAPTGHARALRRTTARERAGVVHVRPAATGTGGHDLRAFACALRVCVHQKPCVHIAANAKKHMTTQSIHERAILSKATGAVTKQVSKQRSPFGGGAGHSGLSLRSSLAGQLDQQH